MVERGGRTFASVGRAQVSRLYFFGIHRRHVWLEETRIECEIVTISWDQDLSLGYDAASKHLTR